MPADTTNLVLEGVLYGVVAVCLLLGGVQFGWTLALRHARKLSTGNHHVRPEGLVEN